MSRGCSGLAASFTARRSGMVARLGLQFGGDEVGAPRSCPMWCEVRNRGPRGRLPFWGFPFMGFGGIFMLVAGGDVSLEGLHFCGGQSLSLGFGGSSILMAEGDLGRSPLSCWGISILGVWGISIRVVGTS